MEYEHRLQSELCARGQSNSKSKADDKYFVRCFALGRMASHLQLGLSLCIWRIYTNQSWYYQGHSLLEDVYQLDALWKFLTILFYYICEVVVVARIEVGTT